ncbi:MAG: MFS transporter [Pseudomonadota bacterium]|nr:MFS transporter [Pseudomonadota bacterium]
MSVEATTEGEQYIAGPPRTGFLGSLAVFGERRTLVMLALGFAAGLPNLLIFDTLSAWLREDGLSLKTIGFFALATLTYALKFVWAPLVDRVTVPVLTGVLGHRRSWMLVAQAFVILGLWLIAGSDPSRNLAAVAGFAVLVGFAGATQDIVIDAWRIEAVDESRQGAMAAAYQWGYRIAMIVAGAIPLVLAEAYNWNLSYAVMAALMGIGVAGVLLAPRERKHVIRPIPTGGLPSRPLLGGFEWAVRLAVLVIGALIAGTGLTGEPGMLATVFGGVGVSGEALGAALEAEGGAGVLLQFALVVAGLMVIAAACWPLPGVRTRPGAYLAGAYGEPFADFFRRFGGLAGLILALICLYRLPDFVLNLMNPFYIDLGFTKTEIAEVRKVFGVAMTVFGVFLGGWSVAQLGILRTLVLGSFMGPLSNLVFAWLAMQGSSVPALFLAIGVDNVAGGYAGTALIAYMSSLTSIGFTATQYALFSSLYALPGKLIASQSGRIVESSARSAETGGVAAPFLGFFDGLPADALVEGAKTAQVTPAALGAGYFTFFIYSAVIGIAAIALTFVVVARQQRLRPTDQPIGSEDAPPAPA